MNTPKRIPLQPAPPAPRRIAGGVLPATMLLALLAALWIGGFVGLAHTELRVSYSAFHFNSSLNLAEAAVEKSILSINTNDWIGWRIGTGGVVLDEIEVDLGRGTTGLLRATIHNRETSMPRVVAEGEVLLPTLPPVSRRIEVFLERRRLFDTGFLFSESIAMRGGPVIMDSYNSERGPYGLAGNRNANASVGCLSLNAQNDVTIGNAKIYGYLAVGEGQPNFGPNANVSDLNSPAGTIDMDRISYDISAHLPRVSPPLGYSQYLGTIDGDLTLGYAGATEPTVYLVDAIKFNNRTLKIVGPVEIHIPGSIDVGGTGAIVVERDARAVFYVDGDITIGGTGAINKTADPKNLVIYGTAVSTQKFKLHGSADWVASVYAPAADVELKGGGGTGAYFGGIVGRSLNVVGNYSLHFDESISSFTGPFSIYRVRLWQELFTKGAPG